MQLYYDKCDYLSNKKTSLILSKRSVTIVVIMKLNNKPDMRRREFDDISKRTVSLRCHCHFSLYIELFNIHEKL